MNNKLKIIADKITNNTYIPPVLIPEVSEDNEYIYVLRNEIWNTVNANMYRNACKEYVSIKYGQ